MQNYEYKIKFKDMDNIEKELSLGQNIFYLLQIPLSQGSSDLIV